MVKGLFDSIQSEMPTDPRKDSGAGKPTIVTTKDEPAKSIGEVEVEKTKVEEKAVTTQDSPDGKPDVESQDVEADIPTDGLTPEARKALVKWKKDASSYKKELTELKKQLQERGESGEELTRTKAELTSLQRQIEEANKELFIHRVEATPEWKKGVTEPLNAVFDQVEALSKTNSLDANKLFEAIHKYSNGDKSSLKEMMEGMDEFDRSDIHALAKNIINIERRQAELKSNSKEAYETSVRSQKELSDKQQQELVQQYEKAVTSVGSKFKEKFSSLLPESSAIDFAKVGMDSRQIDTWSPEMKVYAGHAAVVIPELVKLTESLQKQIKDQTAELARIRGGSAKANTTGTAPSSPAEAKAKETPEQLASMSFEDLAGSILTRVNR